MIFERREYRPRPGKVRQFWDAQRQWNTPERFGAILDHCICYFETAAGSPERLVHLYRYDTLDQWRAVYEAYYQSQSSAYFQMVRPWLLRQETAFFVAAPVAELAPAWSLPPASPNDGKCGAAQPSRRLVVETIQDFLPGGLVPYWEAYRQQDLRPDGPMRKHLLGVHVSLVGRLHRVVHYHHFADAQEAERHFDAQCASPQHRAFVETYSPWIARTLTAHLRPSPVEWMRGWLCRDLDSQGGH